MEIDAAAERKRFEEAAYSEYFVNSIKVQQGFGCATRLGTDATDKATFCALNAAGEYTTEGLQPAWIFWRKRAEIDMSGTFFSIIEGLREDLAKAKFDGEFTAESAPQVDAALQAITSFTATVRALPG